MKGYLKTTSVTKATDTGHDGLSDAWEVRYGLNPDDPTDASQDIDNDSYTNLQEYLAETNPRTGEVPPEKPEKPPTFLLIAIVVIIVAVVVGVACVLRKRK